MDGLVAGALPTHWFEAANAIMTTDTFAKLASATDAYRQDDGHDQWFCQGRGHDRAPDMATMLAFVFTDAAISPSALKGCCAMASKTLSTR
jgi:glutamate N-acetyltransferase/amino-acid N-acetyltransferase